MKNKLLNKTIVFMVLGTFMVLDTSCLAAIKLKNVNAKTNSNWEKLEGNPDLRFAVLSDIHNGPNKSNENERLKNIFSTLYQLDSEMDVFSIVGDITDNGSVEQYNTFKSIVNNNKKPETELVISMGNHEENTASAFTVATGRQPRENKEINGYHFITLSPRSGENTYGGNRYNLDEKWLKEQLDEAIAKDPTKPIFLFMHHGIKDTAYGTYEWYTQDLGDLLSKYPQVVNFSGHSHYPLNNPRSIYQKDFTAINTSTNSYFELESGMMYGTIPPNANNASQIMVLDINGTSVRVRKLDLISGQYVGEDWVFDTSKGKDGFKYTDKRIEASPQPYFEEHASVNVRDIKDNSCTITINQAKINDILGDNNDEIVNSYKYDFINKKTGRVDKSYKIWSEYYFLPMSETLTQTFSSLESGTEYEVVVTAFNSYNKASSNTISTSFTTNGGFTTPNE